MKLRRALICSALLAAHPGLADVQPLSIDLFEDVPGTSSASTNAGSGNQQPESGVTTELKVELMQHFRYGGDARLRKSSLEVTPGVTFDLGERTRVRLGAIARVRGNFTASGKGRAAFEIDESYVRQRLADKLTFSFGRQVVAWGVSDFFHGAQLTDVVNPRDFREPALMDLEDARLPVLMSRLHWAGSFELEFVASHERRYHRFDGAGGDFDPYQSLRNRSVSIDAADEGLTLLGNWFLRASKQIGNGDLALVVGSTDQNAPALAASIRPEGLWLQPEHPRHSLVGMSWSHAMGSSVLKVENALSLDKTLNRNDIQGQVMNGRSPESFVESDTLQSMIGVDYFGFNDWVLTLELANEHVFDHAPQVAAPENASTLSALARWTPGKRDLEFNLVYLEHFPDRARVVRFETVARLNDHLKLKFGAIDYHARDPESFYAGFRDQDRVYSSIEITL